MKSISFVIPCYNEEGNVRVIAREIGRVFGERKIPFTLVMVNDGSKDGTRAELKKLHAEDPQHVTAVSFSRNFGKEAAILCGLTHAAGDYVCIIDADMQQRPEVALSMYEHLEADPDLDCVAAYQDQRNEDRLLIFFKKAFYKIMSAFSEIRLYPGASDFRMMRRNMRDAILSLPEVQRFSKGIFSWVGFNTKYIPYVAEERNSGTSKWSFIKLFHYAMDGITAYTVSPLKLPYVLAALTWIADIIYLIVKAILTFGVGIPGTGNTWIIALILFFGGVQLFTAGVTGTYLAKTYMQGKERPVYLEKEVLEAEEGK